MPFTPFHMGPALLAKSVSPRHFSLPVFALTQIGIDLEVLVGYFVIGNFSNHTVLHTMGGATLVAGLTLLLLRPVLQPLFRLWNRISGSEPCSLWHIKTPVPWSASVLSVLVGAWSHVVLDAMMHHGNMPFAPWTPINPLFDAMWLMLLVPICVITGAVGSGILLKRSGHRRRSNGG